MPHDGAMQRTFGRRTFDFSRAAAVMAIINRTPDSFYDRGADFALDAALATADRALAEGADWLDVGGVKAGPGPEVDETEELERVLPVVEALRPRTDAVISVDTFRSGVARRVLAAGADVVNDPSGLHDPELATVTAEQGGALVVTHTGGPAERIIVDPGHDFHKNTYHSLELTRRLGELTELGYPVLVALSNKDFIGETLDVPLELRVEGSLAAAVVSVLNGASIVRVHEVGPTVRALRMTEAIIGRRPPATARRGLA